MIRIYSDGVFFSLYKIHEKSAVAITLGFSIVKMTPWKPHPRKFAPLVRRWQPFVCLAHFSILYNDSLFLRFLFIMNCYVSRGICRSFFGKNGGFCIQIGLNEFRGKTVADRMNIQSGDKIFLLNIKDSCLFLRIFRSQLLWLRKNLKAVLQLLINTG